MLDPFKDYETKIDHQKSGFKIANKVYFAKEVDILQSYKNQIYQYYGGNFQVVDFTKSVEVANEINKFIADSTDNEIQKMVDSKMFDETCEIILVNAIYFENLWKQEMKMQREKSCFYSAVDKTDEVRNFLLIDKTDFKSFQF
uniref:Serpin domain-containing protein n=1 Tax=Panagrolaimus davidi TaxID=227884 RepID=A0A914Q4C0_9BILA